MHFQIFSKPQHPDALIVSGDLSLALLRAASLHSKQHPNGKVEKTITSIAHLHIELTRAL